ncbi:adenylosuccinate lyase [Streptococcus pneumoniae]|nr:adenylosuccinate lyase [Streptococcus pneumoniae]
MFSEQRRREEQALLAQDYALEQAEEKGLERGRAEGIEQGLERGLEQGRAEGIEQGLERGLEQGLERGLEQGLERGKVEGSLSMLLNLVRQGLLTSEVASQQLGMTVAEFESLL